jgi:hypothetical protein
MRFRLRVPRPEHTDSSLEEQAEWKKNLETKVEQIHIENPDSPKLQPAERLWTLTNEPIANRSFESLDMEKVLAQKNRRTKANASEKVGRGLEYQIVCLIFQEKLACKWCARIVTKENKPNNIGVVRAIAKSDHWR